MKRFTQLLLAIVAVSLISWYTEEKPKPIPPDDPADVNELLRFYGGTTKLDGDGNIIAIQPRMKDVRTEPTVAPALLRLRHVRELTLREDDDEFLRTIGKHWSSLQSVVLYDDVTDHGLAELAGLRNLTRIATYSSHITDAGVKSLAKHRALETLTIEKARLTDACMQDIAALPELRWLDLRGNRITDAGLKRLKGEKLEYLTLVSTRITDRGIENLKEMKSLKQIEVFDTKVTQAGCAELIREIPGLKVWGRWRKSSTRLQTTPPRWPLLRWPELLCAKAM